MPKKYKKSTIIKEGQDRVDSDESRHYVDKAAFYQALVERTLDIKEAELHNLPKPNISNYIGECIMKIATNLAKKHQFSGYSFKDEMIADAVYHCLKYEEFQIILHFICQLFIINLWQQFATTIQ